MQYTGGKYKVAKELAAIISVFGPRVYWEPFVGAENVIQYVNAPVRIGSDLDIHIASFLECLRDGWLPPAEVSELDYKFLKSYQPLTRECYATKAAVGYGCSFGGKFFGGYARDIRKDAINSFARASYEQSIKQAPRLKGIHFKTQSFLDGIPEGVDLIYCDPPYANTTKCGVGKGFDSKLFWDWCRAVALRGITVLVTEFTAPDFAMEIWSKEKPADLRRGDNKGMTERLFLVRGVV
jgi:DNA adenine methylase